MLIGASLSEPHIDEFAVNFPFISLYLYIYRTSCRKSLPARILRVIASCVNSNRKRIHMMIATATATTETRTRTMNGLPQQGWRLWRAVRG